MKTVPHVEIMKTGEYVLSTGPVNFTKSDLASAVAALDDQGVHEARIAIGHRDGRFDGEPAFGKCANYSLEDSGHTLYADLVGIPDWMAPLLPLIYPNRSIEGQFGYQSQIGSKTHDFVITRLALLGVALPGISTLEDLQEAVTGNPEYILLDDPAELVSARAVAAFVNGEPMKKKTVEATITVEDVRRAFYGQVATGDHYDWWIREIQIDPSQVIVYDEDDGEVFRIPYASGADGQVEFADPQKVEVVYQDIAATGSHRVLLHAGRGKVYDTEAESRPEGADDVKRSELRASLGMAEDATEADVAAELARLRALDDSGDEDDDDADDDADDSDDADDDDDDADGEADTRLAATRKKTVVKVPRKKAAANAPAPKVKKNTTGTVTVDASAFQEMQDQVKSLTERSKVSAAKERELMIDEAISEGKIPPKRRAFWLEAAEADPDGIKEQIEDMEAILPVREKGTGANDAEETVAASGDYDPSFLSASEQARVARVRGGQSIVHLEPGTIAREV